VEQDVHIMVLRKQKEREEGDVVPIFPSKTWPIYFFLKFPHPTISPLTENQAFNI
jgi:hypothetical protein